MIRPTGVIDPSSPKTYGDETATSARVSTIKLAGEPEWVKTNHTWRTQAPADTGNYAMNALKGLS